LPALLCGIAAGGMGPGSPGGIMSLMITGPDRPLAAGILGFLMKTKIIESIKNRHSEKRK